MDGLSFRQGLPGGIQNTIKEPTFPTRPSSPIAPNAPAGEVSFQDTLNHAIGQVNQIQKTSDSKARDLATGKTNDVADVMISAEKADIALRLLVQMRNKVIEAYQDIMRMQV